MNQHMSGKNWESEPDNISPSRIEDMDLTFEFTSSLAKDGLAIALKPLLQDDGLSIPKVVMGRDGAFAVHPGASILDL